MRGAICRSKAGRATKKEDQSSVAAREDAAFAALGSSRLNPVFRTRFFFFQVFPAPRRANTTQNRL
jgi:hypothetical protein